MNNKKNNYTAGLSCTYAALAILALTSCGSDDGDTGLGGVTIPTGAISINSSNAQLVATETTEAKDSTDTASSVVTESNNINSDKPVSTAQKASNLVSTLARRSNNNRGDSNISILATQNCPQGGTYTNPDTTTGIGDYVYDKCQFADFTVSGSISIKGTGDLIAGTSFTGSYLYNELTISTAEYTSIFDGIMNIDFTVTGEITEGTYEIPSLTYVFGNEGVKISNYSFTFYKDAMEWTFDYNYTVSSTVLGGSVSIETTQSFKQLIASIYPYEGQLIIYGAENSSARLTVEAGGTGLATDYVTIEIDADGGGVYEESRTVQWQDL